MCGKKFLKLHPATVEIRLGMRITVHRRSRVSRPSRGGSRERAYVEHSEVLPTSVKACFDHLEPSKAAWP